LKIDIMPYLSEKSCNFDKMSYTVGHFELDERHVMKNEKVHWTDSFRQNAFLVVQYVYENVCLVFVWQRTFEQSFRLLKFVS